MTYTIELDQMRICAFHGCYSVEQEVGNWYEVYLALRMENDKVFDTDEVTDTLNYLDAYAVVSQQMAVKSHTIEHVARRIAVALTQRFASVGLRGGSVRICKLAPPVGGAMRSVNVIVDF